MLNMLNKLDLTVYNCDFIDIRLEKEIKNGFQIRNGELEQGNQVPSLGAFIRVQNKDKWYYASTTNIVDIPQIILDLIDSAGIKEPLKKSMNLSITPESREIARAEKIVFLESKDKIDLLSSFKPILDNEKLIIDYALMYNDRYSQRWYKNSQGRFSYYDLDLAGIVAWFSLKENNNIFQTSYTSTGHFLSDFQDFSQKLAEDLESAKLFINAPTITPGNYPVILSEEAAGIFAHESFGHKSEADFMLDDENLKLEWELGKKVSSEILSIVDEGDVPGTSGYVPFDDEGTVTQKTYLIKNGVLAGRLHSEKTAQVLHEETTGNARAINFFYEPIVRMTNTYIEAGDSTFEELCSTIEDGFYIEKVSHGSGLSTFTLAVNRAYRIKDGKLAEPVKINVITGSLFQTLYDIDGLSNQLKLLSSVMGGCGKNEQWPLPVSFGGPKVRIRKMMVS